MDLPWESVQDKSIRMVIGGLPRRRFPPRRPLEVRMRVPTYRQRMRLRNLPYHIQSVDASEAVVNLP